MGKGQFNNTWLERTDSNDHCVGLWCVKKDENTATCTLCQKDINITYMGFGALNQHVEKQRHKGFAGHLSKSKTEEKTTFHVKEAQQTEEKSAPKVIQDFFMKKIDKPSHNLDVLQDKEAEPGQTIDSRQKDVWSVKQMAIKAEIIATLHFAAQNLPFNSSKTCQLVIYSSFLTHQLQEM